MSARPRIRVRYCKQHDLRWLGHQDFVRTWERLLRRADVRPAQTEGFHKRPRMNFPSALAVGIAGVDEVMELELTDDSEPADVQAALNANTPPGLTIKSVERLPAGAKFSHPAAAEYAIPLPEGCRPAVQSQLDRWRAASDELPASVQSIELHDGVLHMRLKLGEAGAVRPRDLLTVLSLADLEQQGAQIVRTCVEVAS